MSRQPVYVELAIRADVDELWEHSQNPALHEQWDLRFTEINYLPRQSESSPQQFLYTTRIGFGLRFSGTGETTSRMSESIGDRISTLRFGSEQKLSLIKQGGGYWKYNANSQGVTFSTLFDYQTRFGVAGRMLDRMLFRPLFGYATAWSFDRLRIWLEHQIPPAVIAERAIIHYISTALLTMLWIYEGLVPKLLFPESGELAILTATGWFNGWERLAIGLLGGAEMLIGLCISIWHRKRWAVWGQLFLLVGLTIPAIAANPAMLQAPFNPFTLMLPMIGLTIALRLTTQFLPEASRCLRKLNRQQKGTKEAEEA